MKPYSTVLLALQLEPESDQQVIEKAKSVLADSGATLWLIHSIEHLGNFGAAYGVAAGIDVDIELKSEAQAMMEKIGQELQVPEARQVIIEGPAKHVIVDEAKTINADLIIVGSHGRHGVRLLLGSTANAILHAADCDVLAVRIRD